jgi:hypothetical protein
MQSGPFLDLKLISANQGIAQGALTGHPCNLEVPNGQRIHMLFWMCCPVWPQEQHRIDRSLFPSRPSPLKHRALAPSMTVALDCNSQ